MGSTGNWMPVVVGGARILVRLAERDRRWVTTGLVVEAADVSTALLKMVSTAVTGVVDGVNAMPDVAQHLRSPSRAGVTLDKAIGAGDAFVIPKPTKPRRARLTRPDGTDPDGYYRKVAAAYADAVMERRPPAQALADEAGVPLATARGWIREARRRGALAPGRRKAL